MAVGHGFLRVSRIVFIVAGILLAAVLAIAGLVILIGGGTPDAPRMVGAGAVLYAVVLLFFSLTLAAMIKVLLEIAEKLEAAKPDEPAL